MAVIYTKKQKKSIIIRSVLFVAVLIAFGVILSVIFMQMRVKAGIHEIEAEDVSLASEPKTYHLYYYLEKTSGASVSDMQGAAEQLYSSALDDYYTLLDSDNEYTDVKNLWYLNHHPNEDVTVDEKLYEVLKEVYDYNPAYLYMGGLYEYWNMLMYTTDETSRNVSDPLYNEDYEQLVSEFVNYNGISLDFKENSTIRLEITSEYVNILESDEVKYIDLGPLKTAYVFDYIRGCFAGAGLKNGYIYSEDGYLTDFGMEKDIEFTFPLVAVRDGETHTLGDVKIQPGYSYCILYGFETSINYQYEIEKDGVSYMRTSYINPVTGIPASPENTRVTYHKGSVLEAVKYMYSYLFDSVVDGSYISVDSRLKIHTNDKLNEFSSYYEVIYE